MTDAEKLDEIKRLLESLAPESQGALAEAFLEGIIIPGVDTPTKLNLTIRSNEEGVRIDFGKKIAWIGLPKSEAIQFASLILEHCGAVVERLAVDSGPGEQGDLGGSNGGRPKG